jgi:hypothetical protein
MDMCVAEKAKTETFTRVFVCGESFIRRLTFERMVYMLTEAQRHRGTEAQRHRGTEAQRHRGTEA